MGIVTMTTAAVYRDEHVGGIDFGRGYGDTTVLVARPSAPRKFRDYSKYQRDLMNPRVRSIENSVREPRKRACEYRKRACDTVLQIRDDLLAVRESLLKDDADTGLELVDTLIDNIENHISER